MNKTFKVTVRTEKIFELVRELKDDLGFQTMLFNTVLEQLPTAYADMIVREYYFKHCHIGDYYKLTHPSGIHMYFTNEDDLRSYLLSVYSLLSTRKIKQFINQETEELYGFKLSKEKREA
jgi:hypothetical protein